jgi:ribosomal protein S18 acetylase RimI-like enzyme
MQIEAISTIAAFVEAAGPLLAGDGANNTFLLSAVQAGRRSLERGEPVPEDWDAAVVRVDTIAVAAARIWRDTWYLSAGPSDVWQAFGRWAGQRGGFDGILGPEAAVRAFERGAGCAATTHMTLPLMRLDGTPVQPNLVPGRLRQAVADDMPLLLAWREAFRVEAKLGQSAEQMAADLQRPGRLQTQYLWVDPQDRPLGLVGGQTIAPSGARIGPVYTPPELRGQGIGGAMVATLAHRLQGIGARWVFLFTDASNPTSNALYRRIGFVQIGRHIQRHITRVA